MNSLYDLRQKLGVSQQEMAHLLGVSRSMAGHAEQGIRSLPTAALLKMGQLILLLEKAESDMKATAKTDAARVWEPENLTVALPAHQQNSRLTATANLLQLTAKEIAQAHCSGNDRCKLIRSLLAHAGEDPLMQSWLQQVHNSARKQQAAVEKRLFAQQLRMAKLKVELEWRGQLG